MTDVTFLVKPLESGQFEASVLGLATCRVEAESKELAIDGLKNALLDQLKDAELVSFQLPTASDNPWKALFGIFKDDPYFQEVVEIIQAERDALGDEEIDPAYYMPQDT